MDNRTEKRRVGDCGEQAVVEHLLKNRYNILDRNYLRKWGELDIVAEKEGILHFVEVKTVSREIIGFNVNHETTDEYMPEDNMHPWKLKRLRRVIQTYLLDKDQELEWQFDLATVYLGEKSYRINFEEDLII